jgi:hypothetical protein
LIRAIPPAGAENARFTARKNQELLLDPSLPMLLILSYNPAFDLQLRTSDRIGSMGMVNSTAIGGL